MRRMIFNQYFIYIYNISGTFSNATGLTSASLCRACNRGNFCPAGSASQTVCPSKYFCPGIISKVVIYHVLTNIPFMLCLSIYIQTMACLPLWTVVWVVRPMLDRLNAPVNGVRSSSVQSVWIVPSGSLVRTARSCVQIVAAEHYV